jgi:hypothetical protein
MQDLVRYRAMESLCRQNAVFRPLESWQLLAEAEMWHHKALEEIASRPAGMLHADQFARLDGGDHGSHKGK